jgi:hypothetical protein
MLFSAPHNSGRIKKSGALHKSSGYRKREDAVAGGGNPEGCVFLLRSLIGERGEEAFP